MPKNFESRLKWLEVEQVDDYSTLSDAELIARIKQIDGQLRLLGVDLPDWPEGDLIASGYFDWTWQKLRQALPDELRFLELHY